MELIRKTAQVALIFIFLVIIAGSTVRMTGSGMGCPDWPKCFGYYIPPTSVDVLQWETNRAFLKGQMIIKDNALWVAQSDFTSSNTYNPINWEKYTKHSYATFNVAHTYTEYVNRLFGALSGIPVLLLLIFSLTKRKQVKGIFWLSAATLFMLGFEAWLGKKVVDGNLIPGQITIHMVGALAIVVLLLIIINKVSAKPKIELSAFQRNLLVCVSILSLVQIALGTQVREGVDVLLKSGVERTSIIDTLGITFKIHRSFSILVVLLNAWLIIKTYKSNKLQSINLIGVFLVLEVLAGMALAYLYLNKWMQPTHLLFAFLLFTLQINVLFKHYFSR